MVRLSSLIGRLVRRQETASNLPDIDLPLPTATTSTAEGLPGTTTSSASPTPTPRSTALQTTTRLTSAVPTRSSTTPSTTAVSTTPKSQTLAPTASTTTSATTPDPVIIIRTTAASNTDNVSTTLAPTTSVVIESKTVTGIAAPSTTSRVDQAAAVKSSSFLENKVASGIVFGLCGLVGLLLIFLIVWFAMRKRRRVKQLEKEIISFDPEDIGRFHQRRADDDTVSIDSLEKGRRSGSSLGQHAGNGYAPTMNIDHGDYHNNAPHLDYRPQRAPTIQRPGNAAFNPASRSDMMPRTYAMPSQTYNQ